MSAGPNHGELRPLHYHGSVVAYLRDQEPDVWRWASERCVRDEQLESLRAALLRDTYRIDAESHRDIHAPLAVAMDRLGLDVPATLYQSPGEMNASLIYVPGEVHILLQGSLLERLSNDELLAVFGHELSHYLLWSQDDGQFLVADRILNDALLAAEAPSHRETYRLYALHTELFADRGSAIAAGGVEPAVAALVKLNTGMGVVDAAAYLRQAAEIEGAETQASAEFSHPETFIRARALALWWGGAADLEKWIASRLHGPLGLERLDLLGQVRLEGLTRGFIAHYLSESGLNSEVVLAQLRLMFPDWREKEPAVGPEYFSSAVVDESIHHYLNAVMLDLALVDPDQRDLALLRAGRIAHTLGSLEAWLQSLRRDAGFGKRELDKYKRQLAKVEMA